MLKMTISILFVIHGFITMAQSSGLFTGSLGIANPGWIRWWPVNLGQSWLLAKLGLESRPILALTGVLWLAAGIGFLGTGLSLAGWIIPHGVWSGLAGGSALVSLVVLALFFHPLYVAAVILNVGIYLTVLRGMVAA